MIGDLDQQLWRRQLLVAGVDEAGWGAWAGPVYAACVVLYPERAPAGLNDSKQLTPTQREALYGQLHDQAHAIGVGWAEAAYFNQYGAAAAWQEAMAQAITRCLKQLGDYAPRKLALLIDGIRDVDGFRYLHSHQLRPKLDGLSWTVAAASVIAKVERDRRMVELDHDYPAYGLAAHKGYGVPQHLAALRRYGALPIHRQQYIETALAH